MEYGAVKTASIIRRGLQIGGKEVEALDGGFIAVVNPANGKVIAEVAAATFERVLASYPEHPRALYGLAVASILTGQSERAKEIFRKLTQPPATSNTEGRVETPSWPVPPGIRAWSHIYLGRIYDVEENRELALTEYRAALAVEGAPEEARNAAQRGLAAGFKPARPGNDASRKPPP